MPQLVLLQSTGASKVYHFTDLNNVIYEATGIPFDQQILQCTWLPTGDVIVRVSGRLLGGKGGFGTLLKSQKGRRRRTHNFDACRTLEGIRVGKAKKTEQIAKWKEGKEREQELIDMLGGEDLNRASITRTSHKKDAVGPILISSDATKEKFNKTIMETTQKTKMLTEAALKERDNIQRLTDTNRLNQMVVNTLKDVLNSDDDTGSSGSSGSSSSSKISPSST